MQAILLPLLLSIGIALCGTPENPSFIGPVFSMVSIAICVPAITYFLWMKTYDTGQGLIEKVLEGGLTDALMKGANILGCMTLGALIPKFVNVTTSIAWIDADVGSSFRLQTDFFDAIMPGMLPLLTVFFMIFVLRKGVKSQRLMWITMIVSVILSVLGILGAVPAV